MIFTGSDSGVVLTDITAIGLPVAAGLATGIAMDTKTIRRSQDTRMMASEDEESNDSPRSVWQLIGGAAQFPITLLNSVFEGAKGGDEVSDAEQLKAKALVVLLPLGAILFVLLLT